MSICYNCTHCGTPIYEVINHRPCYACLKAENDWLREQVGAARGWISDLLTAENPEDHEIGMRKAAQAFADGGSAQCEMCERLRDDIRKLKEHRLARRRQLRGVRKAARQYRVLRNFEMVEELADSQAECVSLREKLADAEAKGRREATQPIKCPTCGKLCLVAINDKCHDCWAKLWYAKGRREVSEEAAGHILKAFRGAEAKTDFPSFADALASSVRSLASPASKEPCGKCGGSGTEARQSHATRHGTPEMSEYVCSDCKGAGEEGGGE